MRGGGERRHTTVSFYNPPSPTRQPCFPINSAKRAYLLRNDQFDFAFDDIDFQLAGRGTTGLALLIQAFWCCLFCFFPWFPSLFCEGAGFSVGVSERVSWSISVSVTTSLWARFGHPSSAPRGGCSAFSGKGGNSNGLVVSSLSFHVLLNFADRILIITLIY